MVGSRGIGVPHQDRFGAIMVQQLRKKGKYESTYECIYIQFRGPMTPLARRWSRSTLNNETLGEGGSHVLVWVVNTSAVKLRRFTSLRFRV